MNSERVPILSELLPERIVDRLAMAQAEWYRVAQMSEAKSTQLECGTCITPEHLINRWLPLKCSGRCQLLRLYETGHKAVAQVQWVKHVCEMVRFAAPIRGSSFPKEEG